VVHYPLETPPVLALYTRYDFTRIEPAEKYAEAFIRYAVQPGDMVAGTASMTCYRDFRELCEMSYSYAEVPYFEWLYLLRYHDAGWRIEGISDGYRPNFMLLDLYK
jgi:hypothetical protein